MSNDCFAPADRPEPAVSAPLHQKLQHLIQRFDPEYLRRHQRQRLALACDRRFGRCSGRPLRRPCGAGHAGLRGGLRGSLDPRRSWHVLRAGVDRRRSSGAAAAGAAASARWLDEIARKRLPAFERDACLSRLSSCIRSTRCDPTRQREVADRCNRAAMRLLRPESQSRTIQKKTNRVPE